MRRLIGETIDVIVDEEREPLPEARWRLRRQRVAAAARDAVTNSRACADVRQPKVRACLGRPPLPVTDTSPRGGWKR
jgi:hypothetical protein